MAWFPMLLPSARTRLGFAWRWERRTGHVLRLVIRQGMKTGVAAGDSNWCYRSFRSDASALEVLYQVTVTDSETFVAISLLLALVALAACYIPARRATKVDPLVALRYELMILLSGMLQLVGLSRKDFVVTTKS